MVTFLAMYNDKPWRKHSFYRPLRTFWKWVSTSYDLPNPFIGRFGNLVIAAPKMSSKSFIPLLQTLSDGHPGFEGWNSTYNFDGVDWNRFSSDPGDTWSKLNGEQRRRCELAGIILDHQKELDYLADGPLARWIGGEARMVWLNSDGRVNSIPQDRYFAISSGATMVKAVYLSMFYIQEFKDQLGVLKTESAKASNFTPNWRPPTEIVRITANDANQEWKGTVRLEYEEHPGNEGR